MDAQSLKIYQPVKQLGVAMKTAMRTVLAGFLVTFCLNAKAQMYMNTDIPGKVVQNGLYVDSQNGVYNFRTWKECYAVNVAKNRDAIKNGDQMGGYFRPGTMCEVLWVVTNKDKVTKMSEAGDSYAKATLANFQRLMDKFQKDVGASQQLQKV